MDKGMADEGQGFVQRQFSLHPEALRPGFLWTARLPMGWAFLDTHPASWRRNAEGIVDEFYAGARLKRSQRSVVLGFLEKAVKASQDSKVLLSFVLPGALESGEVSACTLVVRWHSFSPDSASMAVVERAFGGRQGKQQCVSGAGNPFLVFGGETKVGPVTDRRVVWNYQAVMPVLSTPWAVMISGMAPTAELGEMVREIVLRVVNNIQCYPQDTDLLVDPRLSVVGDVVADEQEVVAAVAVR